MTIDDIAKIMSAISVHYPAFKRHIMDSNGNISRGTANEWYRQIGYLSLDDAYKKLDKWLSRPEEQRKNAPDTAWFKASSGSNKDFGTYRWKNGEMPKGFDRISPEGWLTNAEGMIFAYPDPDRIYETYHFDSAGRIVDSQGRLAGGR